jgi:hypothetical protein
MNIKESTQTKGFITDFKIFENQYEADRNNPKVHLKDLPNKITNASLAVMAGLYGGTGAQTAFTYGELGTSNTAVSAAHTALQTAITDSGLQRIAATMSRTTTTQTNDTTVFTLSWTSSGSKTIEEFGTFNASSAGVMGARVLTTSQAVVSGNIVNVTYSIKHVGN